MPDNTIREALERNAKAVALRPSVGQKTGKTAVHLKPGLTCGVSEGAWSITVGMGTAGGVEAGPGPGTLGRGALGSCLALSYAMWAARLGVVLDTVDVTVEADYDSRDA
ncbi:MAG: OsmC family protein [Acidobacteria bacterium]|nr:OsmC family protein [Acidobacteriota bacterium]MBA3886246.1 OsmC family protein [Acidobacteriota bacterium]